MKINLKINRPTLLIITISILIALSLVNYQSSEQQQWHQVFSSHVEERSLAIEKILSGKQDYIQQAINHNRYIDTNQSSQVTGMHHSSRKNDANLIEWSYYYPNIKNLILKYNELCSAIGDTQKMHCIKVLSDRLTQYHTVINKISKNTFYQYHFYHWPDQLINNQQSGHVIKVNVEKALLETLTTLSPPGIAVTINESSSGFNSQFFANEEIVQPENNNLLSKNFANNGQQWQLNYSISNQYLHLLPGFNKVPLLNTVIIILISFFFTLLIYSILQFHKSAKENKTNMLKLNEINRISGIGCWEWNIGTNTIIWSDEIYNIFDLEKGKDKITYDLFVSRIHPDDRGLVKKHIDAAIKNKNKNKYNVKHRILDSKGETLFVHEKGQVIFNLAGNPVEMLGTVLDITLEQTVKNKLLVSNQELEEIVQQKTQDISEINTELKQWFQDNKRINKELLHERNRAQQYLDIANVILLAMDAKGKILLINKKGQELLGYSEHELLGENWFNKCLPVSCKQLVQERYYSCIKNNEVFPEFFENEIITKQGEIKSIAWRNAIMDSDHEFVLISSGTDKTELKQSLELLGRNQQSLDTFSKSDLIGVISLSAEGLILSVNHFITNITGYSQEELVNHDFNILLLSENDTSSWLHHHSVSQGHGFSLTLKNNNANLVFTHVFLKPVFNTNGQLELFICLIIDVSEKVKESTMILEQEKRHKKTLIREVHHRIKNHLQGLMGLIQNYELEHPEVKDILEKSRMQISSLAITYGLQGANDTGELYLCDLLSSSVKFCQQMLLTDTQEMMLSLPAGKPFLLMEEQAVSVSLIVNELLLNAIKYSSQSVEPIMVSLSITENKNAVVKIENCGSQLPPGFDFKNNRQLGTGLELVKTLIPDHMSLNLYNSDSKVVAEFNLTNPLVIYSY